MPKPVRAASRFALGAVAALALIFGGLTAPAFADDLPVEPPVSESDSVETPTAPIEEDAPEDSDAPAEGEAEEAGETVPAGEDAESPESQEPSTAKTDTATEAETGTLFGASAMSTMDADEAAPTVTVSKTTGLARDGETITVSGTGFVNAGAATTGTRPPLAGEFTGAYIVFGKFADSWKPTDNAASSARFGIETRWGVLAEDLATIGGEAAGGVVIEADGSFSITMTVSATIANDIKVGNYGIYTYAAGGAKYAPFETYTPLAFTVAAPQVFVSKVSDLDWGGETITVSGTGFVNAGAATTGTRPPLAGKFTGAYVAFGKFLDAWKPTE
ncbi:MAG TPA: hypothetical protein VNR37_01675, partial [Microbacteriaceae bacterium]|nr:hypothetical protein [Microbacteriaceae bacterium]